VSRISNSVSSTLRLRVLVERLHVRVGGGGIEVEVLLLHVLAVIALVIRETEEALFQDGIAAVPKGEREAEPPFTVADAQQAVLAPAIGPAPRVIVGKIRPARAVG